MVNTEKYLDELERKVVQDILNEYIEQDDMDMVKYTLRMMEKKGFELQVVRKEK